MMREIQCSTCINGNEMYKAEDTQDNKNMVVAGMKETFRKIFYFIFCPLVLISFLLEPFIDDIRVYLGVGFITDKMGGIDRAWEIKPPGNRLIFYLLSKLPGTGLQYQIVVKAVCVIIAIVIIWYFARQIAKAWKVNFDIVFILSFVSVFCVSDYVQLETEWFCVLLIMLMIGLWLEENPMLWILSGFLCLPLILLKGVSIVLIGTVWATVRFIQGCDIKRDLAWLDGAIAGAIGFFLLGITVWPHMFSDAFLSSALSPTQSISLLYRFEDIVPSLFVASLTVPMLFCGIVALILYCFYIVYKDAKGMFWIGIMWFFALLMSFIQGELYYYHVLPVIIQGIITILYIHKQSGNWKAIWFPMACIMVAMWILFAAGWSPFIHGERYQYWADRQNEATAIDNTFNLSSQPELLYLDVGDAQWYFRSKSASRFTYAFPVIRDNWTCNLSQYQGYRENYHDIIDYRGEYIISNQWYLFRNMTPDKQNIKNMLNDEYNLAYGGYWEIWQRKTGQ